MTKQEGTVTKSIALGLLALVPLGACVSPERHRETVAANEALRQEIEDLQAYTRQLQERNETLEAEVARLGRNAVEADYLRQRKEELARLIEQFQQGGVSAIPGVTVIETAEGIGFQLQGEVLFDSGKATLRSDGKDVLRQLVPALARHEADIRIDGHTDTDPIVHSQWRTNLRLSAERAMAVVEFLKENGIDAGRLHIAAFGQHRPAVEGSSPEAKRRNRRVEIMMLRG